MRPGDRARRARELALLAIRNFLADQTGSTFTRGVLIIAVVAVIALGVLFFGKYANPSAATRAIGSGAGIKLLPW